MTIKLTDMPRLLWGAIAANLPTPTSLNRGGLALDRDTGVADRPYMCLNDGSGVPQWEHLVTEEYGDTVYADIAHTHASTLIIQEGSVTVDATVGTIDFDASDFNISEPVEDTIGVALAYGTSAGTPAEGNHNHDSTYVNVTGDTMTGELIINVVGDKLDVRTGGDTRFQVTSSQVQVQRAHDLVVYSDGAVTQVAHIDGATGDIDTEGQITLGSVAAEIIAGTSSPEGVHSAPIGSLFLRTDGGANTAVYRKESGTGNTGWVAIASGSGATITVQEGDSNVDTAVTTLDFDASDFNVTSSPAGEANVALAYGTGAGTPAEGNHNHDSTYVNVSGDTMTGALLIDVDSVTSFEIRTLDDAALVITNGGTAAADTRVSVDTVNFSGTGALNLANGCRLQGYSDAFASQTLSLDASNGNILGTGQITIGPNAAEIIQGTSTPEAAANAPVSSQFMNQGATIPNTELYIKQAGTGSDTTGWVPVNMGLTFTVGPFYINDLPGTATTQATLGYFNTATAVSRDTTDPILRFAGRIVGLILVSDVARTAGTATGRLRIGGSDTAFNGGAVALDATNTEQDASFVNHASGVAFTSSQSIGVNVTTSGWTPITANITAWLVVSLDPFV